MGNENGEWIMHGMDPSDPDCLRSPDEVEAYIEKVGFLPLFASDVPGFSVEEHVDAKYWWTGDVSRDPWEWRAILARRGNVAYGKFFDKKAGFLSKAWLPYFVNARRDGYDFDALWDDEKASLRDKRIMDLFDESARILSNEIKERAGFADGGEKNFDGTLTSLQMRLYLCVSDFKQRKNKKGEPYGWAIAELEKPETRFGYDLVSSAYKEEPAVSRERILDHVRMLYPGVTAKQLRKL